MSVTDKRVQYVEHPLAARLVEVTRVTRLTPAMVRVTLGGPELAGFRDLAPADHVKLCLAVDGAAEPVMPIVVDDGLDDPPPGAPHPVLRDYTVRDWRPQPLELDIDMVLHGDGPGSAFAASAAPGDRVGVLGPRGSEVVPLVFDWYLLGCDETGLPALARWLEALPAGAKAFAYAEVADAREEQPIASAADVTLTWLHRDGVPAGRSDVLPRAISGFTPPPGDGYAWMGAEATTLKPVRRFLRNELGLPKERVDIDGYWKRAAGDEHPDGSD